MNIGKLRRVRKLANVGRYSGTFDALLDAVPADLVARLTAGELAAALDFGRGQHNHGWHQGYDESAAVGGSHGNARN